jgi:hypothetical protein
VRRFLGKKIDAIMADAAMVIVGNDYLGQGPGKPGPSRGDPASVVDLSKYPAIQGKTRKDLSRSVDWIAQHHKTSRGSGICLETGLSCRGGKVVLIGAGRTLFGADGYDLRVDREREAEDLQIRRRYHAPSG